MLILSHSRNCFPFIFTQQLYILSSIFSYNKLNYSISSLIHILGNVMNSCIWPRTHSSCIHKLKSSLYDGVSFPLYMFKWALYMLILSLSGTCLLASLYTLALSPATIFTSHLKILLGWGFFVWMFSQQYDTFLMWWRSYIQIEIKWMDILYLNLYRSFAFVLTLWQAYITSMKI